MPQLSEPAGIAPRAPPWVWDAACARGRATAGRGADGMEEISHPCQAGMLQLSWQRGSLRAGARSPPQNCHQPPPPKADTPSHPPAKRPCCKRCLFRGENTFAWGNAPEGAVGSAGPGGRCRRRFPRHFPASLWPRPGFPAGWGCSKGRQHPAISCSLRDAPRALPAGAAALGATPGWGWRCSQLLSLLPKVAGSSHKVTSPSQPAEAAFSPLGTGFAVCLQQLILLP